MTEPLLIQRPQTSHSCATTERSEKKIHNQLWDQMLRKSTADGFYHAKPRKQSPFKYSTQGDWNILMGRTSPDSRCGSHIKKQVNNDSLRTSFYKTESFLSPDKTGYNRKTNDGQFRVVKVNHFLWQSDVLNQKQKDDRSSQKNGYFHQMLRTQESSFQDQRLESTQTQASPRRAEHYNRYVSTNFNRYYGGEGYMHRRRDSKNMVRLIGEMEQMQLNKSAEIQKQRNSSFHYTNAMDDIKRKSIDRGSINLSNMMLKNNDRDLNFTMQTQTQNSPKNNYTERGRQTSLGFTRTSDSKGFSTERGEQKHTEPFDQKIKQRSGRKMPQYMKDLFSSKKIRDSLQY